jgi:23S rRNA pseudouridine1911/1915/1917 synthase
MPSSDGKAARKPSSAAPTTGTVGPELDRALVDAAVRSLFGLSWGRARELVKRGKITVDGQMVMSPTVRVRAGASIAIDLAARRRPASDELSPEALVHVDAHVVVVEKPAGISTVPFDPEGMAASIGHRARPGEKVTLDQRVRAALARQERARGRGGPPPEIGVVHRLDKETSGLVVFTRSWQAKKALSQAFRFHRVHRRYLALVHGVPKAGTLVSHFVEDRGDGLRGSVERRRGRNRAVGNEKTQRAVTHVEVLEHGVTQSPRQSQHGRHTRQGQPSEGGASHGQPWALVACRLETGRTHQIRIHLSEAGHPLIGERVYVRDHAGPLIPAPRVMLHAAELGFEHPATGREMRWVSELPADMKEMLAFLRGEIVGQT